MYVQGEPKRLGARSMEQDKGVRMKQRLKWTGLGVIVLLVAGQVVRPDRTNPASEPAVSFKADTTVSAEIRGTIQRACFDCHSNETRWPWYSAVTPVNYFLVDDVLKGRKHLNFSEWGHMKPLKRQRVLGDIVDELSHGDMPPGPYRLMHSSAALSESEMRLVMEWANAGKGATEANEK